jgi:hypothetical protein
MGEVAMKISISRNVATACIGLTMVVLSGASCTANEQGSLHGAASPQAAERQCSRRTSAAVALESPDGHPFNLAYHPGCGWSQEPGIEAAGYVSNSAVSKASDPVTLFIDGPTGYAFAWTADAGWKFIGHVIP